MRPVLLLMLMLTGCKNFCLPYAEVWAANALGDAPGASMVLATYGSAIDGCAAIASILEHRPEPYSDMFPRAENIAVAP